jgi:hypothetical protein
MAIKETLQKNDIRTNVFPPLHLTLLSLKLDENG